MISSDRGMLPEGISLECSCNVTFCQSINLLASICSCHWFELPLEMHSGLMQRCGYVNLNCCSIPRTERPHNLHMKVPYSSSGRTSLVRVTVPLMVERTPSFSVVRSRILQ